MQITPDSGPYTRIVLREIEVTARIGLASWERQGPQRLLVGLELYASFPDYPPQITTKFPIDYDRIAEYIQSWPTRAQTDLAETLLSDLLDLCLEAPQVAACKVCITAPQVLDHIEACAHRRDYQRRGRHPHRSHSITYSI